MVWPSDPWINSENLKMDIINIVNPAIKIAELEISTDSRVPVRQSKLSHRVRISPQ